MSVENEIVGGDVVVDEVVIGIEVVGSVASDEVLNEVGGGDEVVVVSGDVTDEVVGGKVEVVEDSGIVVAYDLVGDEIVEGEIIRSDVVGIEVAVGDVLKSEVVDGDKVVIEGEVVGAVELGYVVESEVVDCGGK